MREAAVGFIALGLIGGFAIGRSYAASASQCTPVPALMEDWKRSVVQEMGRSQASDAELATYISGVRTERVQNLSRRFEQIAEWHDTTRKQQNERVLWENQRIMVLVDSFAPPPKVLVVAKSKGVWLLTDASAFDPGLIDELARVAAAAADSAMVALNQPCDPQFARIHIHPPKSLGVRQLHIHVQPQKSAAVSVSSQQLADRMASDLSERLAKD